MLRKISRASGYNTSLRIKDYEFRVKHAASPEDLEQGLMHVDNLAPENGCLLDFGKEQAFGLWMKNCRIDLTTLVLNKQGEVTDILHMAYNEPYKAHHSHGRYALELNPSTVQQLGIKVGDRVEWPRQSNESTKQGKQ